MKWRWTRKALYGPPEDKAGRPWEPAVEDKATMTATLLTVSPDAGAPGDGSDGRGVTTVLNAEEAEIVSPLRGPCDGDGDATGGWGVADPGADAEHDHVSDGDADNVSTTLATNDYRIWPKGKLERLTPGRMPAPTGRRL